MLQSGAFRTLFRNSITVSASRTSPALRLARPSASFSPLVATSGFRFEGGRLLGKSVQAHAFASMPSRRDEQQSKSPQQQIQELLKENTKLKAQVAKLEAQVANLEAAAAKKPNKFMGTLQQYGMPFLIWWTGLYFFTGVTIYGALDFGLVSGQGVIDFIMQIGLDKFIDPTRLDPTYGNIAIAVIVNECLEVLRFPFTLATLPYVKRIFSRGKSVEDSK